MIDKSLIKKIHKESVNLVKSISQKGESEMMERLVECYEKLGMIYALNSIMNKETSKLNCILNQKTSELKIGLGTIEQIIKSCGIDKRKINGDEK